MTKLFNEGKMFQAELISAREPPKIHWSELRNWLKNCQELTQYNAIRK